MHYVCHNPCIYNNFVIKTHRTGKYQIIDQNFELQEKFIENGTKTTIFSNPIHQ